jgi:hypothetical protein
LVHCRPGWANAILDRDADGRTDGDTDCDADSHTDAGNHTDTGSHADFDIHGNANLDTYGRTDGDAYAGCF